MTSKELKDFIWYQEQYAELTCRATQAEIKCDELKKQIDFLKRYIKHLEARAYNKKEG